MSSVLTGLNEICQWTSPECIKAIILSIRFAVINLYMVYGRCIYFCCKLCESTFLLRNVAGL